MVCACEVFGAAGSSATVTVTSPLAPGPGGGAIENVPPPIEPAFRFAITVVEPDDVVHVTVTRSQ